MVEFITLMVGWFGCFGVIGGILMCGDPDSGSACGKANYWLQVTLPDSLQCVNRVSLLRPNRI